MVALTVCTPASTPEPEALANKRPLRTLLPLVTREAFLASQVPRPCGRWAHPDRANVSVWAVATTPAEATHRATMADVLVYSDPACATSNTLLQNYSGLAVARYSSSLATEVTCPSASGLSAPAWQLVYLPSGAPLYTPTTTTATADAAVAATLHNATLRDARGTCTLADRAVTAGVATALGALFGAGAAIIGALGCRCCGPRGRRSRHTGGTHAD